jgi:hypothetical protein
MRKILCAAVIGLAAFSFWSAAFAVADADPLDAARP